MNTSKRKTVTAAASKHLGCSAEKGRKTKKETGTNKHLTAAVIDSPLMQGNHVTLFGNWLLPFFFLFYIFDH